MDVYDAEQSNKVRFIHSHNERMTWERIQELIMMNVNIFHRSVNGSVHAENYIKTMIGTPMLRKAFRFAFENRAIISFVGILDVVDDWTDEVYMDIYSEILYDSWAFSFKFFETMIMHPKRDLCVIKPHYDRMAKSNNPTKFEKYTKMMKDISVSTVDMPIVNETIQIYEEIIKACEKDQNRKEKLYFKYLCIKQDFINRVNTLTAKELLNVLQCINESKFKELTPEFIYMFRETFKKEKYIDIRLELFKLCMMDSPYVYRLDYFNDNIVNIKDIKYSDIMKIFDDIIQDKNVTIDIIQKICCSLEYIKNTYKSEFTTEMYYAFQIKFNERIDEINASTKEKTKA